MNDDATTVMHTDLDRLTERVEKAAALVQQLRDDRARLEHDNGELGRRLQELEQKLQGQDVAALVRSGDAMDSKNQVQVQIFGHSYTIRGEADQTYILDVAAYVDRKMREITEKLPVASLSKVAILASLNIADELFKERAKHQNQAEQLNDRAARLNAVLDDLLQDSASR
jgi:cell division protein ZapA